MSPVFRHGRLRLYLLKLLDEAPRHGYEVIRLLQDRFLGVYAPSPGTIYPRLARLEEEGLVTHDEVDGKKIYRITDKGREEIQGRLDDLAELEEELSEAVRDIAREVTQDVRDTVRSLREELTSAARDLRRQAAGQPAPAGGGTGGPGAPGTAGDARAPQAPGPAEAGDAAAGQGAGPEPGHAASRPAGTAGGPQAGTAGGPSAGAADGPPDAAGNPADAARRIRAEARRAREQMRDAFTASRAGAGSRGGWSGRGAAWQQATGGGTTPPRPGSGAGSVPGGAESGGAESGGGLLRDLERMAMDFAGDLRASGWRAEGIGESAAANLRGILDDALTRIREEILGDRPPRGRRQSAGASGGDHEATGTAQPEPTAKPETTGAAGPARAAGPDRTDAEPPA
ncbi:MAG: PadR family transcriptional regulator [Streptosporangiaceae bacterium]